MQDNPYFKMDYPIILGTDVAGTIAQLGSGVTRFKIGQRVIGHCDSLLSRKVTNAGYQLYSTCPEILVSVVPDSLPLAKVAVLPLSISTATAGLFNLLKLPLPLLETKPTGKTVLIWGGSSSCGSSSIQYVPPIAICKISNVDIRSVKVGGRCWINSSHNCWSA
jgi:NADPH:quinone reductase-like Zn-dependent oxidoreductase